MREVHKGPNDLEHMAILRHKFLDEKGIVMGTVAIR